MERQIKQARKQSRACKQASASVKLSLVVSSRSPPRWSGVFTMRATTWLFAINGFTRVNCLIILMSSGPLLFHFVNAHSQSGRRGRRGHTARGWMGRRRGHGEWVEGRLCNGSPRRSIPLPHRREGRRRLDASTVRDNWFGPASFVPRAINGNQTQLILIASDDH